jgi:hypothetical protein
MLNFLRKFYKSNKPIEYPFDKNYRNGYKKLWINSLQSLK